MAASLDTFSCMPRKPAAIQCRHKKRRSGVTKPKRRKLPPPRAVTGREKRWINPNRGLVKLLERNADILISRFLYPHLSHVWNPYSRLVEQRFSIAEISLSTDGWPGDAAPVRVLLLSDVHAGIFLKPEILASAIRLAMDLQPDLVAVAGDIVTGHAAELVPYLAALQPLAAAPLGAWFCYGNHDYFDGNPEIIEKALASIGIQTLKNRSVRIQHGSGSFVLGGIDDLILGDPDWEQLSSPHGPPQLLLAHNPDQFYEAEARGVAIMLSGHTHGGQIRLPNRPPVIRQSRFGLDEGAYRFHASFLIVSRGVGSIVLPWRWGADPEMVLVEIISPAEARGRQA